MKRKLFVFYGKFLKVVKDVLKRSLEDNITGLGAQMAFYFVLAFFPFMIFIIALLSYSRITSEDVLISLAAYIPKDVYEIVIRVVKDAVNGSSSTVLSFGAIGTWFVASNAVEVLVVGINNAYDFEETRSMLRLKWLSFLFTFVITLVFIFSLITVVFGGVIAKEVLLFFKLSDFVVILWDILRYIIPTITVFTMLMIIYYYMPSTRIGVKKIIPGAVFSTAAWMIISQVFGYYINNFGNYTATYGSVGGIIAMLLWLHWSSISIMLGAELISALYYLRRPRKKFLE